MCCKQQIFIDIRCEIDLRRYYIVDSDWWVEEVEQKEDLLGLFKTTAEVWYYESIKRRIDVYSGRLIDNHILSTDLSSFNCQEEWIRHHLLTKFPLVLQRDWARAVVHWFYHHADHFGELRHGSFEFLRHVLDLLHATDNSLSNCSKQPSKHEKEKVLSISLKRGAWIRWVILIV